MAGRIALLLLVAVSAVPSVGADGMLDPSFGNGGIVLTDFNPQQPVSFARSVVVLPDGRAVAAGNTTPNLGGRYMAVARYLPSGALDPSFGNGGLVIHMGGPFLSDAFAEEALLQPDGRLVLVGGFQSVQGRVFALLRLAANGGGDPSFGMGGVVNTPVPGGGTAVAGVLQPDGRIVAVGNPATGQSYLIAARYTDNGTLDPAFGSNGIAALPLPLSYVVRDVALQPDGKLVIAGIYGANDFILVRLLPSGAPDPSFDGDGVVTTNFGGAESGYSVIVLPDGRIVLAGSHNGDFALVRYLTNGSVDTTFGNGGLATASSGVGELPDEVILLPNGKLIVAGSTTDGNPDFHLARFHPSGTLDTSFGTAGFLRTDIGAFDECHGVAIAGPDLILTAGSRQSGNPMPSVFALARYIATTPVELLTFEVE